MVATVDVAQGSRSVDRFAYRPALDGLRAVAVLLVLVAHNQGVPLRTDGFHGGFLGVDMFFVLSGYLITSLLLVEHDSTGRISFGAFWGRRARRLLPALLVMLLIVAVYAAFLASPAELGGLRGDAFATLFYFQNWHLIFGSFHSAEILNHAWSLSVEEQWYLLWPAVLLLILVWGRSRREHVLVAIVGLALVSAGWTFVLSTHPGAAAHIADGTDTRAQQLLIGAGLAVLLHRRELSKRGWRAVEAAGLVGVAVIAAIVATSNSPSSHFFAAGGFALFAIAVAAVISASVRPTGGIIRRGLSSAPLRAIGLISYGMYLYHWPLYFWLTPDRTHTSGVMLLIVRLLTVVGIAGVSFVLVERPIRHGLQGGKRSLLMAPAAIMVVVVAFVFATREPSAPALVSAPTVAHYAQIASTARGRRVLVVGEATAFQLQAQGGTYDGPDMTGASFGLLDCGLVAGDLLAQRARFAQPSHCSQRLQAFHDIAGAFRPDVVVLMPEDEELFDRVVADHTYRVGTHPWATYVGAQLDSARRALATSDVVSTIVIAVPCTSRSVGSPWAGTINNAHRRDALNEFLDSYAIEHRDAVTVAGRPALPCGSATAGHTGIDTTASSPGAARELWSWLAGRAAAAADRQ